MAEDLNETDRLNLEFLNELIVPTAKVPTPGLSRRAKVGIAIGIVVALAIWGMIAFIVWRVCGLLSNW